MADGKKDQLFKLLCEAGATKEEISNMLNKFDAKNGTGSTVTGAMTDASKRRHVSDDDGIQLGWHGRIFSYVPYVHGKSSWLFARL